MLDSQIEKLLIVQDRDIQVLKLQRDIDRIPVEKRSIEAKITEEEANIEAARQDLQAKEILRNDIDLEVKSKEAALQRFRTQQLEIKKNDEYQAMTLQIEQTEQEISDLEGREIEVMLEIDEAQASFDSAKEEIDLRITEQKKQIKALEARLENLKNSLGEAQEAVLESRESVAVNFLESYDRAKNQVKRPPYVAPLRDQKCDGCHLRVSNDVAKEAKQPGEPHFCDQCARMVFA
ncbi:MAG: hypothetical protein AAGH40_11255 [Verrucomicrobiota bacterium]